MSKKLFWAAIEEDPCWNNFYQNALSSFENWVYMGTISSSDSPTRHADILRKLDILLMTNDSPLGQSYHDILTIKQFMPVTANLLVITAADDINKSLSFYKKWADGYIIKETNVEKFRRTIANIQEEGAAISPEIAKKLVSLLKEHEYAEHDNIIFTPKEWQILNRLAHGDSYADAARKLRLSINTFRYYIKKIYRRLNVENRTSAVIWYIENKQTIK